MPSPSDPRDRAKHFETVARQNKDRQRSVRSMLSLMIGVAKFPSFPAAWLL
jgi:hypothetical protein